MDGVRWIRIPCGWICQFDEAGCAAYETANESQSQAYFHAELVNRRRLAAALCAVLTKSHSLPNARRVAKAVIRHVQYTTYTLLNLPNLSLDELLNALNGSMGLKKNELLEFIKIGASLSSDPPKAVVRVSNLSILLSVTLSFILNYLLNCPINTPTQYTLPIRPVDTPYQLPYQYTLLTFT